ncbi:MAG TPA: hypothetical protein VMV93_10440 [Chloroflexota bacterium]|nr:hypothetical protein [Chloroflexota bacterium]
MPTIHPRHTLSETRAIAEALNDAAQHWPADAHSRSKLLLHLIDEGHQAVLKARQRALIERREAVTRTSGALTGAYGTEYLARLRQDWPA